ncbi:uncharacterized protein LOC143895525 isoform X2 [Temnothorax americanus]|uniref:uncharacterized protein LOC143895525 isoform X2 n=1 Tax=Temnothorax americanus TaxID=1964332 RepID=UPI004067992E
MTKIAIISCIIVAVCVFQTARAGIFDTSGLDSILGGVKSGVTDALGNVKKAEQEVENRGKKLISDGISGLDSMLGGVKSGVTDALGNVKKAEQEVENRGKGLISDIQNKLESSKSQLQTSTGCTNVYSDAQQMINNLIAVSKTCISTEIQADSTDIQKLSNAVNNLTGVLEKSFQDGVSCFQKLVTPWEITQIAQCFSTIPQDLTKIPVIIEEVMFAADKLVLFFPTVGYCFQKAVIQSVPSNAAKLVKDVEQCFTNVLQPFNS